MSGTRPSLFEDDGAPEIDLTQFTPRPKPDLSQIPTDEMRRLSEASGFPSRTASVVGSLPTVVVSPPPLTRRPVKTGRTVLLNARVRQSAHDRFHAIVAAEHARFEAGQIGHKPTLGEIVERALAALEREIAEGGPAG